MKTCAINSVLFSTDHLAVVFLTTPLAPSPSPWHEIVQFPLLSIYGSTLIDFLRNTYATPGCRPNYRVLLDSFDPMTRLVEANAGVAIIPGVDCALRLCTNAKVQAHRVRRGLEQCAPAARDLRRLRLPVGAGAFLDI